MFGHGADPSVTLTPVQPANFIKTESEPLFASRNTVTVWSVAILTKPELSSGAAPMAWGQNAAIVNGLGLSISGARQKPEASAKPQADPAALKARRAIKGRRRRWLSWTQNGPKHLTSSFRRNLRYRAA